MNYRQIIKRIAKREQVSEEEVKTEMEKALACAGIQGSAEDFIKIAAKMATGRYIA